VQGSAISAASTEQNMVHSFKTGQPYATAETTPAPLLSFVSPQDHRTQRTAKKF